MDICLLACCTTICIFNVHMHCCDNIVYTGLPKWTNGQFGQTSLTACWLDAWNVKCVPWEHNKVGSAQLAPDCGRKGAAIVPWYFSDLWSCTVHLFCVYEAPEHAFHLPTITSVQLLQDALIGLFWQRILLSCFLLLSLGCKWRHGFRSHICSDALWPCTVTCSVVMFSCLFCSFCPKSCPICVLFCSWFFFHDTIYSFCTIIILSLFFFFFFWEDCN